MKFYLLTTLFYYFNYVSMFNILNFNENNDLLQMGAVQK